MQTNLPAIILSAGLLSADAAVAQPRLTAGRTVTVSASVPDQPHAESMLAINPRNPRNMLACASKSTPRFTVGEYVTHDGGDTWAPVTLPVGDGTWLYGAWDPATYFGPDGVGYLTVVQGSAMWITRSADEGRTWSGPVRAIFSPGIDREFMAIPAAGAYAGRVYAAARTQDDETDGTSQSVLAVATSIDGGRTFGAPHLIARTSTEHLGGLVGLLTGPDGALILPFTAAVTGGAPGAAHATRVRLAVSTDGGDSYTVAPPVVAAMRPAAMDGTKYGSGMTAAIDLSDGPYRGRIYVAALDVTGDRYDVSVIATSDYGRSWSAPVRLTDNPTPAGHANPAIAVNKDGVLAVTWNDRRAHKSSCYDFFASASLDGGRTFLPNVKISEQATCSSMPGNWLADPQIRDYPRGQGETRVNGQGLTPLTIATRFPSGGDTQGLMADPNGVFHTAWIDGSSGVMQIKHTPITVTPRPVVARSSADVRAVTTRTHRDVSLQIKLAADRCAFDFTAGNLSCDVHLVNRSQEAVRGPFVLVLQESRVNLKGWRADNMDNGVAGIGAAWNVPLAAGELLAPGAMTPTRTLRWRFSGVPEEPSRPVFIFDVRSRDDNNER